MLAFVAALLLTAVTVSSACVAQSFASLQFTIEPAPHDGQVKVRFERHRTGHSDNNWDSSFMPSELAGLDIDRMDLIGGEVRVWGKGAKERVVPVGAPAREAIAVWLVQRAPLAADDERALFIGVGGRRISARTIERRLAAWAIKRGLHRHVHPHMLRHSFASHVLQ